jgi:uroporphyrinogen-III decarboxylase
MDIYDRPEFVHDLMRFCTDWLVGFYRRLGETGIHSISMNETWTGVGVAREHFVEFMKPYEAECVKAAHDAGYMVSFHNCGRAKILLEDIADTGPDAIETLTSDRSSGDVDLADAKRRIGDRVCLFGGFNEHLLHESDAQGVIDEVKRCIDAAAGGGGYVLRSTGQIFDTKPGMIELMCETAREYGKYN